MNITNEEKPKIKQFFDAVNEMIDGRFILSDIKVANILKAIANSEVLYNFFAEKLVGFNFKREYHDSLCSNSQNGGYFHMPEDENRVVAYTFCFLLDVDNGKINLQNFVTDNFYSADGYNISYSNFALIMLIPFKNSVKMLLGVDENGECNEQVAMDTVPNQITIEEECVRSEEEQTVKITMANIMKNIAEMQTAVNRAYKLKNDIRDELSIILKALKEAVKYENFVIINALIIPLREKTKKDKLLYSLYCDLENYLIDFYSM